MYKRQPQEEVLDIGGQDVVKVPNLVGKPVDTALNELNQDGFTVRTDVYKRQVLPGRLYLGELANRF